MFLSNNQRSREVTYVAAKGEHQTQMEKFVKQALDNVQSDEELLGFFVFDNFAKYLPYSSKINWLFIYISLS